VFGEESAPTIVMVHGWTEASRLWTHQIRDLVADYRVVAYDQRGHGRSGRSADRQYTIERLGYDLDAVLRGCVPPGERPLLVGHSMGAITIVEWARQHDVEARISGALLANTGVGSLVNDGLVLERWPLLDKHLHNFIGSRVILNNPAPMVPLSTPIHHAAVRHLCFGPTASPATVDFMLGMVAATPAHVRAAFGRAMDTMDLRGALERITVPTVMLAGEIDLLTPPVHALRMAELVTGASEVVVVPGAGHLGQLEFPAAYTAAIRDLAARTTRSATAFDIAA
jgi:pimeloyl-ACP methyl ester carboxylesterase